MKQCENCGYEHLSRERRTWCHACGLLLCSDCFTATNHDHTHHMARLAPPLKFSTAEIKAAYPDITRAPWQPREVSP